RSRSRGRRRFRTHGLRLPHAGYGLLNRYFFHLEDISSGLVLLALAGGQDVSAETRIEGVILRLYLSGLFRCGSCRGGGRRGGGAGTAADKIIDAHQKGYPQQADHPAHRVFVFCAYLHCTVFILSASERAASRSKCYVSLRNVSNLICRETPPPSEPVRAICVITKTNLSCSRALIKRATLPYSPLTVVSIPMRWMPGSSSFWFAAFS